MHSSPWSPVPLISWKFQKVFLIFVWVFRYTTELMFLFLFFSPPGLNSGYSLVLVLASKFALINDFPEPTPSMWIAVPPRDNSRNSSVTSLPGGSASPDAPSPFWALGPQGLTRATLQFTLAVLAVCLLLIVPGDRQDNQHTRSKLQPPFV